MPPSATADGVHRRCSEAPRGVAGHSRKQAGRRCVIGERRFYSGPVVHRLVACQFGSRGEVQGDGARSPGHAGDGVGDIFFRHSSAGYPTTPSPRTPLPSGAPPPNPRSFSLWTRIDMPTKQEAPCRTACVTGPFGEGSTSGLMHRSGCSPAEPYPVRQRTPHRIAALAIKTKKCAVLF